MKKPGIFGVWLEIEVVLDVSIMTDIHDTTDAEAVATSSCSANDAEAEEVSRISALVQILHRKTQQEKSDAYAELVK